MEKGSVELKTDFKNVYDDTSYFINAIVSEYGFYQGFINSMAKGTSQISINRKQVKKIVAEKWVTAIESALPALDMAIRTPSKEIIEKEEVMPIELSRNINNRSIRHLAQHTNYISRIEDGVITPSKILNVFHDETIMTYENKFLNTLIQRLFMFIERRFSKLKNEGLNETGVAMDFSSAFSYGETRAKINMNIEVMDNKDKESGINIGERIEKLYAIALKYIDSDFVKSMKNNYIRPPVMRTNAITKNKNLSVCLALWDFIETYDDVGYSIDVIKTAENPDPEYIKELYSMISLQFMMFKYNLQNGFKVVDTVNEVRLERPISPKVNVKLKDIEADDYNVYDSEYRRVIPISQINKRKLTRSELKVREAVEIALTASKKMDSERRKLERKAEREQKKAEVAAEKKKLSAENRNLSTEQGEVNGTDKE